MPLPASGAISLSQVNVELGLSATAQISLNDSAVRTLFGRASGAISMSDGYGKANQFAFTIASNQTNANLRTLAVNAGWNQTSKVVATINSGVYISSNSTGVPALTINGSFPGGVELTNNGFIVGMGGNGGTGGGGRWGTPNLINGTDGAAGGNALTVSVAASVRNNGTIGGGGGGGGGGASRRRTDSKAEFIARGGGGGGGRSSAAANSAGGAIDTSTAGGYPVGLGQVGQAGTVSAPGNGGAGYNNNNSGYPAGGDGGVGGQWGAAGATGASGARWSLYAVARAGGAGGSAVSGNGNITWLATGTRLGAIA